MHDPLDIRSAAPPAALVSGLFDVTWTKFKEKPWELIGLFFLIGLVGGLNNINCNGSGGGGGGGNPGQFPQFEGIEDPQLWLWIVGTVGAAMVLGTLFGFFMMFITVPARTGGAVYWLRHLRDQDPDFGCALHPLQRWLPIVFTHMLAAVFIMIGYMLFIIPGIILTYGLSMLTYVMIDHDLKYMDAIKATWKLTDGYKLHLFGLQILTTLLVFAGMLCMCVGVFVATPVAAGMWAAAYTRLARRGDYYMQWQDSGKFIDFAV
jgi:hypothetical protein